MESLREDRQPSKLWSRHTSLHPPSGRVAVSAAGRVLHGLPGDRRPGEVSLNDQPLTRAARRAQCVTMPCRRPLRG